MPNALSANPNAGNSADCRKEADMKYSKFTILYSRISKEDDREDESMSVENQKSFLEAYAKDKGFTNIIHLIDDGFKGSRWDRPSITQLLDEIEKGNVSTVICKDLS